MTNALLPFSLLLGIVFQDLAAAARPLVGPLTTLLLMLGFSIYLSYGYTRSAVGAKLGRPKLTPATLKVAALGFLLVAIGLFAIPHDLGPKALMQAATDAAADRHERALYGLIVIFVGLVMGIAGASIGAPRGTDDTANA